MRVGFIGLGNMGRAMVRNLVKAGHEVIAWNRTRAAVDALAPGGVKPAATVADTLAGDVVLSMLADDASVAAALIDSGAIAAMRPGQAHFNMATISIDMAKRLAAAHAQHGSRYVSAPVFGRVEVAAAAKLFVVAAGDQAAIAQAQPLFDAMGQRTFNVGAEAHAANLIKISGNLLVGMAIEGLAETVALARKSGLEADKLVEVLTQSIFAVPVYQGYGALIAKRQYEPVMFRVPLALKDISLALAAGEAVGAPLPCASLVRDSLLAAIGRGYGEKDWAALGAVAAENAGLPGSGR